MKKLVLAFGALLLLAFSSCMSDSKPDKIIPTPTPIDTATVVTGVAIDGAMNSVYLKVGEDTMDFSYPELDSEYRDSWEIDDTLTIRYFKTENGDSVIEVINQTD